MNTFKRANEKMQKAATETLVVQAVVILVIALHWLQNHI